MHSWSDHGGLWEGADVDIHAVPYGGRVEGGRLLLGGLGSPVLGHVAPQFLLHTQAQDMFNHRTNSCALVGHLL